MATVRLAATFATASVRPDGQITSIRSARPAAPRPGRASSPRLKLDPEVVPLPVLVIDRIEPPTDN